MTMTDRPGRLGAAHIAMTTVALAALGLYLTVSAGASGLSSPTPDPIVSERPIALEATPAPAPAPLTLADPLTEPTEQGLSAVEPSFAEDDEDNDRETVRPAIRDEDSDDDADRNDSDDDDEDRDKSSEEESSTDKPSKRKDTTDSKSDNDD